MSKKSRYKEKHGNKGKKQASQKHTGIFQASGSGYGFVKSNETDEEFFISRKSTHTAVHGDLVEIKTLKPMTHKKKAEAEIVRIIERGLEYVVGTFEAGNKSPRTGDMAYGFVISDDRHFGEDIFVSRERSKGAKDGDKVVVRITDYGNRSRNHKPEGIISEILGDINDPGVDILSIIRSYGLNEGFSREVMNEADVVAKPVTEDKIKNRKDLRELLTITIDGVNSKDFDDAVSLVRSGEDWELGVHIADVAEYVKEGGELDREALRRGTSIYLPDRVIPMLPEALSNDICSLNPHEDRLTVSCLMTLDRKGKIRKSKIVESVIRSHYRMTYDSVQRILDNDPGEREKYKDIVPMLEDMNSLAHLIRKRRVKHGAVDFDLPEPEIILDDRGRAVDVKVRERDDATGLIEDFMLMANETVARTFAAMNMPFLYRSHDEPDKDRISELALFVSGFGYHIKLKKDGRTSSGEIQKLMEDVGGTQYEKLIRMLALRTMKQAGYTTEPKGHYGLAMEYYTHFTSPIRRYPDLQIHRIIKEYLRQELKGSRMEHYSKILKGVAEKTSFLERKAVDVERDADKLKMVEYMQSHIGEEYEGIVSGVTDWGIYVELPNTIEGMIRLSDMNDYYELDEFNHQVVGRATGQRIRLGDRVKVGVLRADKLSCEIDLTYMGGVE